MYNLYNTLADEFYCLGDSQLPPNTINIGRRIELNYISLILLCSKIAGVNGSETSSNVLVNVVYNSVKCDWGDIMVIADGNFIESIPLGECIMNQKLME